MGDGANLRANAFGPDGSIWVAGNSGWVTAGFIRGCADSPNWPLKNPYPNAYRSGLVLARFKPVPLLKDASAK